MVRILFTPSAEWYTVDPSLMTVLEGLANTISHGNLHDCTGAKLAEGTITAEVNANGVLKAKPSGDNNETTLVVEVSIVGAEQSFPIVATDPTLYDLRVVVDVATETRLGNSATDVVKQINHLLGIRNNTFISTRRVHNNTAQNSFSTSPAKAAVGGAAIAAIVADDESSKKVVGFLEAVKEGLCKDGGLFMPRELPKLTPAELAYLCADAKATDKQRYQRTAQFVVEKLMGVPKAFGLPECKPSDAAAPIPEMVGDNKTPKQTDLEADINAHTSPSQLTSATDLSHLCCPCGPRYGALPIPSPATIAKCIANAYPAARWNHLDANVSPLTALLCGKENSKALEKKAAKIAEDNKNSPAGAANGNSSPVREGKATAEGAATTATDDKPGEESPATPATPPSSPAYGNVGTTTTNANANGFEHIIAEHSRVHVLEQYHGPTAAFKDFALQLFPGFFAVSTAEDPNRYMILAATSGDTGVAAINGFMQNGAPDTKVMVLFPETGVSPVQKAQMLSYSDGKRVQVVGLGADFDFCQSTVKKIFNDKAIAEKLLGTDTKPTVLSSANSINWGRLLPQIVYYVHAYVDLVVAQQKLAKPLDAAHSVSRLPAAFDVVVPSGNFGNILSCYVAKLMGLPVRRFIVASNENDVLAEFINTGVYDITARTLTTTSSPSIDILRASNVERFLYFIHDGDTNRVRELMKQLDTEKRFALDAEVFESKVKGIFWASTCAEDRCRRVVNQLFVDSNGHRLFDPHTGVGAAVVEDYLAMAKGRGDVLVPIVLASTAHWGKFPEPVMDSLGLKLLDEAACKQYDDDKAAGGGKNGSPLSCCGAGATRTKGGDNNGNIEALAATVDKRDVVKHVKQMHYSIQRQCPNAQPVPSSLREAVEAPMKATPMVMEAPTYEGIVEAMLAFANTAL